MEMKKRAELAIGEMERMRREMGEERVGEDGDGEISCSIVEAAGVALVSLAGTTTAAINTPKKEVQILHPSRRRHLPKK